MNVNYSLYTQNVSVRTIRVDHYIMGVSIHYVPQGTATYVMLQNTRNIMNDKLQPHDDKFGIWRACRKILCGSLAGEA